MRATASPAHNQVGVNEKGSEKQRWLSKSDLLECLSHRGPGGPSRTPATGQLQTRWGPTTHALINLPSSLVFGQRRLPGRNTYFLGKGHLSSLRLTASVVCAGGAPGWISVTCALLPPRRGVERVTVKTWEVGSRLPGPHGASLTQQSRPQDPSLSLPPDLTPPQPGLFLLNWLLPPGAPLSNAPFRIWWRRARQPRVWSYTRDRREKKHTHCSCTCLVLQSGPRSSSIVSPGNLLGMQGPSPAGWFLWFLCTWYFETPSQSSAHSCVCVCVYTYKHRVLYMELKGKKKNFFLKFWSIGEFLEQLYCLDFGIFSGVPSYLCFIYHPYDASSLQWVFTRLPELMLGFHSSFSVT